MIGKFLYTYANRLVDSVSANKDKKLEMSMIEDISSVENESEQMTELLKLNIWRQVLGKQHPNFDVDRAEYYRRLKSITPEEMEAKFKKATWHTVRWNWMTCAFFGLVGEMTGVFNCFFIAELISYIRDPEQTIEQGIKLLCVAIFTSIVQQLCRNFYIQYGIINSVKLRRTLVALLFDKVSALSMKSLMSTSTGKLITVISSDLFTTEKALAFSGLILIFIPVNLFTYILIGLLSNWTNSIIVFTVWLFMLALQFTNGRITKSLKLREAVLADERSKLVKDMVVGVRTIKSYGWENYYLAKIKELRNRQAKIIFFTNILSTFGFNFF